MGFPPVLLRGFGFQNWILDRGGFGFARTLVAQFFFVPRLLAQLSQLPKDRVRLALQPSPIQVEPVEGTVTFTKELARQNLDWTQIRLGVLGHLLPPLQGVMAICDFFLLTPHQFSFDCWDSSDLPARLHKILDQLALHCPAWFKVARECIL